MIHNLEYIEIHEVKKHLQESLDKEQDKNSDKHKDLFEIINNIVIKKTFLDDIEKVFSNFDFLHEGDFREKNCTSKKVTIDTIKNLSEAKKEFIDELVFLSCPIHILEIIHCLKILYYNNRNISKEEVQGNSTLIHELQNFNHEIIRVYNLSNKCFKSLLILCLYNKFAMEQIFCNSQKIFLFELLDIYDLNTIIFLNYLAQDKDYIGEYFDTTFFNKICDTYNSCTFDVKQTFEKIDDNSQNINEEIFESFSHKNIPEAQTITNIESSGFINNLKKIKSDYRYLKFPSIDSEDFNTTPYLFLIMVNRFLKENFNSKYCDLNRMIKNS